MNEKNELSTLVLSIFNSTNTREIKLTNFVVRNYSRGAEKHRITVKYDNGKILIHRKKTKLLMSEFMSDKIAEDSMFDLVSDYIGLILKEVKSGNHTT